MKKPIYMDYHATTPLDPGVLEAMMPYLKEHFGNAASSSHSFGRNAKKAVEKAREQVAVLIDAHPDEIIFTSGATEASNLAIKGLFESHKTKLEPMHMITQLTEHKCVLESFRYLEKQGVETTYLSVDASGRIVLKDLEKAIHKNTLLLSVMFANNEVGTIQSIEEIGKISKEHNIFFHTDAAQAVGKLPVSVNKLKIDLMSLTAHKMYGPKGIGALYIRKKNPRVKITPLLHGGEHEQNIRSGTLNVPAIVGFGEACEIAGKIMNDEAGRIADLRERLWQRLREQIEEIRLNGHPSLRLPGNLNVSFAYTEGESILLALSNDVALSSSSACTSGNTSPSHVLKAMNIPKEYLYSSIRFGLGRFTTQEEVDYVADRVIRTVKKVRDLSPIYQDRLQEGK